MKVILIDNYDSFTYNIVEHLRQLPPVEYEVLKVDEIDRDLVAESDAIFISPGPGLPSDYPQLFDLLDDFASTKAIFGLCLGHQLIGEYFGGTLKNLEKVYHGRKMNVKILDVGCVFSKLDNSISVGRYHSWILDKETLPKTLTITAVDEEGNIMAIKHKNLRIEGVQFHPESYMTKKGRQLIMNFLRRNV